LTIRPNRIRTLLDVPLRVVAALSHHHNSHVPTWLLEVTGLLRQRFETIPGHVLRVVQINGADPVALQSLIDNRKVTPHGLLLSVRGLASVRLTGMLESRVVQLVDSR
jgi:hypothetical protein